MNSKHLFKYQTPLLIIIGIPLLVGIFYLTRPSDKKPIDAIDVKVKDAAEDSETEEETRNNTANPAPDETAKPSKVTFRYPKELDAKYIYTQDWPPTVEVKIAKFVCAETIRKINGREYCIGSESEGAAGSIYTTYTYNTMEGDRMITIRFTLRYAQCGNYSEPKKTECEQEHQSFDLDDLVDRIVQTIRW